MKKWLQKSFVGATALAALFSFSACSDNAKTLDDEYDDEDSIDLEMSSGNSSNSKKSSSSSVPELSDILTDVDQDDLQETDNVTKPSGISIERLAPSVFQLSWEYTGAANTLSGFAIQRLAPTSTVWEDVGAVGPTTSHLVIDGSSNIDYYYRLASFYGKSRSAYSDEVLVSRNTTYLSDLDFPKVPSAVANIDRDSMLEFVLTGDYPSQSVQHSVYNYDSSGKKKGDVYYEARFVYGSSYSVDTVKFTLDRGVVNKKFKSIEDQCNSFGQIRVVWKDKNGALDYSDWTTPIGTKTGTTSGLSGNLEEHCGAVVVSENGFAVPSDVKASQVGSVWMLEWAYNEVPDHPQAGFVIQKLNLKESKWEDVGQTGTGVMRFSIGVPTDEYSYFRVAAIDKDKVRSSYSGDVLITVSSEECVLSAPTDLEAHEYSEKQMTLAWNFEDNPNRPIKGFRIESLNMKTNEWTSVKTVKPEVLKYLIDVSSSIRYFRVVAFDSTGESASKDLKIEANATNVYVLPEPTNVSYRDWKDSILAVSWSYTPNEKRSVKGFVVELLDLDKGTWNNVGKTSSSVKVFQVKISDDSRYYRIGAYDATDTSYSDNLFIPASSVESAEVLLATPAMSSDVKVQTTGKISLSWTYTQNSARPAKGLVLQVFENGAWSKVKDVGLNTNRYSVDAVDYDRYYRVVAYDAKDSTFSNDVLVVAKSASTAAVLNVPTVTGAELVSDENRSLAWSYAQNSDRIATNFIVQKLDMTNNKWTEISVVKKDIHRYTIEVSEDAEYWRIGATDLTDTVYSEDFMVPGVVYELPAPSGVAYTVKENGSVILSWKYSPSKNRPVDYFRVDVIDFVNQAWTTKVAKVPSDVYYQSIAASDQALYYRVVAVDSKGEAPTDGILVEATAETSEILNAPTGLAVTILASGKAQLTWAYASNEKRPAVKFVPQYSTDASAWMNCGNTVDSTAHKVMVTGPTEAQGGLYYRVAAVDAKNDSSFSVAEYAAYVNESSDLPAPTNFAPTMLSDSTYSLSWSYTASKERPVDHFELEKLNGGSWQKEGANIDANAFRVNVGAATSTDQFFRVVAVDKSGNRAYSNDICIKAVVTGSCEVSAPNGITGKILANGNVELTWSYAANNGCPIASFEIEKYDASQGKFVSVEAGIDPSFRTFDFVETAFGASATSNAIYYRVVAMTAGTSSAASEAYKVTYEKVKFDLPAPTSLAYATLSDDKISITWKYTENLDRQVQSFKVYCYSSDGSGKYEWDAGETVDKGSTVYVAESSDKDRYFRVAAVDANNEESMSSDLFVAAVKGSSIELPAPTGFTYKVRDDGKYEMSWSYSANADRPVDHFVLETSTDGYTFNTVQVSGSDLTISKGLRNYVFATVPAVGYYSLVAVDANGKKAESEAIYISMYNVDFSLAAPTSVSYTTRDDGKYEISWSYTQGTVNAESFSIETCKDGKFGADKVNFQTGLNISLRKFVLDAPTEALYYRVVAVATNYENANSEAIYIASNEDEKVLNAPELSSSVDMSRADGKYAITWSYTQGTLNAMNFEIHTSTDGSDWSSAAVATVDPSVTTFVFDAPMDGMYYRVEAVNGDSKKPSNAIYISGYTVDLTLPAPSGLTAFRLSPSVWVLQWNYTSEPKRPELGFRLQQSAVSESATGSWGETAQVEPNVLQYYVLGQENRENFYRVAAFDGEKSGTECAYDVTSGEWNDACKFSDYSNTVQITESTPYRSDLNFSTAPVLNVKGVSDLDAGGAAISAQIFIAVTDDQIAKSISALPYTQKVEYEFRIVTSESGQAEGETTIKLYTGDGSATMIKKFEDRDAACHTSNDTYVQVRAKWTEVAILGEKTLGGVAYTEWSGLMRLGDQVTGCDTAPTGSGSDTEPASEPDP